MFAARRSRALRPFVAGVALAVTVPVLGWSAPAAAEDEVSTGATVVGEFVQIWPEYEDPDDAAEHGEEGPLSFVRTEEGDAVRVDTEDVEELEVGATVAVTVGREIRDAASDDLGYAEARNVLEADVLANAPTGPTPTAPAAPPFTNSVTVAMVNPAGGVRDATTLDDVVAAVNGPVADFWEAESAAVGTRIGVTAQHDWISTTAGCRTPFALWDEVARRVGFSPGAGKHLLLYVSSTPGNLAGCSYGLGTVGSFPSSGGYAYVRDVDTSLLVHELGHNFGLGHSSVLQCDAADYSGACTTTRYGDYYDVMGASWDQAGSLNVVQAEKIGYSVQATHLTMGSPATTVDLTPVSVQPGVRAVEVDTTVGPRYWLEYRPASGRDAWLSTADNWLGLTAGVQLRVRGHGDDSSLLLDATRSPGVAWDDDLDPVLGVGVPVTLHGGSYQGGSITVTVQSVSPTGATVLVVPRTAISLKHEALGGDAGALGPATDAEFCAIAGGCMRSFRDGDIYYKAATGTAYAVSGAIRTAWLAHSGVDGPLGHPVSDERCGLVRGGCAQDFEGGRLYWTAATGAHPVSGAIVSHWLAGGAESGSLGYPTSDRTCGPTACDQTFEGGTVVWSAARGALVVEGVIHDAWLAAGGKAGPLGLPVSGRGCQLVRGGCGQQFAGGSIYWSPATGVHTVTGVVRDRWAALGWEAGLGYPLTDTQCGLADGGCGQRFEHGWLYGSAATPVRYVVGSIGQAWDASGREAGALGYPLTDEICGLNRGGCLQIFQRGSIYWSSQTGAHAVSGTLRDRWAALGAQNGGLGYPVTGPDCSLPGDGCGQRFQGGWLSGSTATGVRTVYGSIGQTWEAAGRETGSLGHPLMDEYCGIVGGGCFQHFQRGSIYWSMWTGARLVSGPVRDRWASTGWETGRLGYPVTNTHCGLRDGGCAQVFQGGSVYSSASTPASVVTGAFRDAWGATGFEGGVLGYPVGDQWCGIKAGGCFQHFQNGSMYWSSATGVHIVRGVVRDRWAALGWENSSLGYPVTDTFCGLADSGCYQVFQGGSVYSSASTPASVVTGAFRDRWGATGFEGGVLGYPTGDQYCGIRDGGCFQSFQRGAVYWSPATGVHFVADAMYWRWRDLGFEHSAALGYPVSDTVCGLVNKGCGQAFERGSLYASHGVAYVVRSAVRDRWARTGWEAGFLGYPVDDESCGLPAGGCIQRFQNGSIAYSPATGAVALSEAVHLAWAHEGTAWGRLGYPVEVIRSSGQIADRARFQHGSMDAYWSGPNGFLTYHVTMY